MPQTILNLGWNPATWIGFVFFLISLFFLARLIRSLGRLRKVYRYPKIKLVEEEGTETPLDEEKKEAIWKAVLDAVIFSAVIIFFYFAFGTGKKVEVSPVGEDGMRKLTEQMPEEKPLEKIKQEAEAKKPKYLKEVGESPGKDSERADEYLKKALERAEKRDNQ